MNSPKIQQQEAPENAPSDKPFVLSRGWLIVGIFAMLLGIAAGIVMSSATFFR